MAISLVTGRYGYSHITSQQAAQRNIGASSHDVRWASAAPSMTVKSTSVTIGDFLLVVDGRYVKNDADMTVNFTGGSTGYSRHDIVALRYYVDDTDDDATENVELRIIPGTAVGYDGITDDAVDPTVSRVDLSLLPKSSDVAIARIKLLGTSVSVESMIGESIVSVADIIDYMTVPNGRQVRTYSSDISGADLDDILYVGHGSGTGVTMRTARSAGFSGYIHSMSVEAQLNPSKTRGHISLRMNLDPSISFDIRDVDEEAYYIDTGVTMTIPDGWSGGYHRYDIAGYSIANCSENAISTTNWIDTADIDISDEGKVYVRATIDTELYSAIIIVNATISTASIREAATL